MDGGRTLALHLYYLAMDTRALIRQWYRRCFGSNDHPDQFDH